MDHTTIFKTSCGALTAFATYFFGGADVWIIALITVIVVDYITGLCKAHIAGELSSRVGFRGIIKKLMYFAIVTVAVIADNVTGAGGVLRVAVIGFLSANEGISILENCAAAGLPEIPGLVKVLNKLKGSGDQDEVTPKGE